MGKKFGLRRKWAKMLELERDAVCVCVCCVDGSARKVVKDEALLMM